MVVKDLGLCYLHLLTFEGLGRELDDRVLAERAQDPGFDTQQHKKQTPNLRFSVKSVSGYQEKTLTARRETGFLLLPPTSEALLSAKLPVPQERILFFWF
jgi:hypothetical protein